MTLRTVRLDDAAERILKQLQERTGMSVSALLKQGLLALRNRLSPQSERTAFEMYEELDLGPGGYAVAPSTDTKKGVSHSIHRSMALDLYEAGHATLAEAARLADLSVEDFIELLGKAGVPAVSYPPEDLADELETAR